MKTAELTGAALDWAVAKCEVGKPVGSFLDGAVPHPDYNNFHPSTDWAQGGPIIERECIETYREAGDWFCYIGSRNNPELNGPTPLIAAMRCFVSSKLGDEVDVPKELTE